VKTSKQVIREWRWEGAAAAGGEGGGAGVHVQAPYGVVWDAGSCTEGEGEGETRHSALAGAVCHGHL